MNIFASSPDPVASARALDDRRLNKMIVESGQILSTSLHLAGQGSDSLYRPAYVRHPVVLWVAADARNFARLYRHFVALLDEWRFRTGKVSHASARLVPAFARFVTTTDPPERFANCTPFKSEPDIHAAYRRTLLEKWRRDAPPPRWSRRGPPDFVKTLEAGVASG